MSQQDQTNQASWAALRAVRGRIAAIAVVSIAIGLVDALAIAGLAAYLASGLVGGDDVVLGQEWVTRPWAILGLAVTSFVLFIVGIVLREWTVSAWDLARRRDILGAFEQADFPAQSRQSGGALTVAMDQAARGAAAIGDVAGLINAVARTVIMLGVAFLAAWRVSIVAVVAGGILVVGLRRFSKRTRVMNREVAALAGAIGDELSDMVTSAREIHLLDRWEEVKGSADDRIAAMVGLQRRARALGALVGPIFGLGTTLVGLGVGYLAGQGDGVSTPALAASGILLLRSLGSAQMAQVAYQALHDDLPYMQRALETIEGLRAAAAPSGPGFRSAPTSIEVRGLRASYGQDVILDGLDIDIAGPGGTAIVGPSGAGKSTLLLALSGLVPPDAGTVSAGGVDLATLGRSDLTGRIAYLPQDPKLLRTTLRSNLLRPASEMTDSDLDTVIDSLGLAATVAGFADGLDARMGRSGEGFSGGELQRLGLGRLVANEPSIWLLDEPTSALDRVNSDRVAALVLEAMEDRMVVLVTHRPELLGHCRTLVLMEDGAIVDQGTPAELAERSPFVAAMIAGTPIDT